MDQLIKYPRTPHLAGSEKQNGDDLSTTSMEEIYGQYLAVEEKLDGSNSGISFDSEANLRLQSRGHFLTGGGRERQFNLLKTWANAHVDALFDILGDRYIMYGEWTFACHAIYYDNLPHYFHEFDIYDTQEQIFLSTAKRRKMLSGSPVVQVPVVWEGQFTKNHSVDDYLADSLYKTASWKETMTKVAEKYSVYDPMEGRVDSNLSEGLYIKIEDDEKVLGRVKYVRPGFRQVITDTDHWASKPILPNQLAPGVDIFRT